MTIRIFLWNNITKLDFTGYKDSNIMVINLKNNPIRDLNLDHTIQNLPQDLFKLYISYDSKYVSDDDIMKLNSALESLPIEGALFAEKI